MENFEIIAQLVLLIIHQVYFGIYRIASQRVNLAKRSFQQIMGISYFVYLSHYRSYAEEMVIIVFGRSAGAVMKDEEANLSELEEMSCRLEDGAYFLSLVFLSRIGLIVRRGWLCPPSISGMPHRGNYRHNKQLQAGGTV